MHHLRKTAVSLAATAVATTGLLTTAIGAAPHAQAATCNNKIFLVDGYGNGNTGKSFGGESLSKVTSAPGWDRELFKYTDGIIPFKDATTLNKAVAVAVPNLEAKAVAYHQACPNAKIAFMGYSFGALVAGNVVADLATKSVIPHRQINAVLYGDPRRAPQNKGAEGLAGGVLTMLPNLPTIDAPGPRDFKDIDVSQVCNENDVICNAANPFTNALAVANGVQGYLTGYHGYRFDPFGADSHPVDHYIPQKQLIQYGAPLPVPIPTPNAMFNNNPTYLAAVKAIGDVVDSATLSSLFTRFGIPANLAQVATGLVQEAVVRP